MSDAPAPNAAPSVSSSPSSSAAPASSSQVTGNRTPIPAAKASVTDNRTPIPAAKAPDSKFADAPEGTPAAEAKAEAARRKYKLKVDGGDEEWEGTDDDIALELQKSRAAGKRFQEAAENRKQVQAALAKLKADPFSDDVKQALGVDLRAMVEERLATEYKQMLEDQNLPAEEKVKREYETKFEAERKAREASEAKLKTWQQEQTNQKVWTETQAHFDSALKEAGLERNHETLWHMADAARLALDGGFDLSPSQLAAEVRGRMEGAQQKLHKSVIGGLKGDALLKHLGDDVAREVVQASLARAKAAKTAKTFPPADAPRAEPTEKKKDPYTSERASKSYKEFFKALRNQG